MKKRMLGVLLPVVAGLGLAGTGFGAWVFSNNVSASSAGATINVTAAYNVTGLKVVVGTKDASGNVSDDSITLDQKLASDGTGHEGDMDFKYHIEYTGEALTGVQDLVTNPNGTNSTDVTYAANQTDKAVIFDTGKVYTIKYSCTVTYSLTDGSAAATYLTIPEATRTLENKEMKYSYVNGAWKLSAPDLDTVTTVTVDWNSKDVSADDSPKDNGSYVDQKTAKPMTAGEYTKMVNAFAADGTKGAVIVTVDSFVTTDMAVTDAA